MYVYVCLYCSSRVAWRKLSVGVESLKINFSSLLSSDFLFSFLIQPLEFCNASKFHYIAYINSFSRVCLLLFYVLFCEIFSFVCEANRYDTESWCERRKFFSFLDLDFVRSFTRSSLFHKLLTLYVVLLLLLPTSFESWILLSKCKVSAILQWKKRRGKLFLKLFLSYSSD